MASSTASQASSPRLHAANGPQEAGCPRCVGADADGRRPAVLFRTLPPTRVGALARNLLAWALGELLLPPVHGAVVGSGGVGVLVAAALAAPGKSTTVLACLERGMELVGDDHCLSSLGLSAVAAWAPRLRQADRGRLVGACPSSPLARAGRVLDKLLVPLDGELASRCAEALDTPLRAVILPLPRRHAGSAPGPAPGRARRAGLGDLLPVSRPARDGRRAACSPRCGALGRVYELCGSARTSTRSIPRLCGASSQTMT